jgi:ADP-ribose pyrophosphatase YjhB (NUDIX family)
MSEQIHRIQLEILRKLLFSKSLRHTDLRPSPKIENNLLGFHLKQLVRFGLVDKKLDQYFLTNEGKEYASRIDTHKLLISNQAKTSVHLCPVRHENNQQKFLIYTRAKQPFFGCQGFGSGKMYFGETTEKAAKRILKEETNLEGKPKLITVRHIIYFEAKTNTFLDDRIVFLCVIKNPTGNLLSNKEGVYEWVGENQLVNFVKKPFISLLDFQKDIQKLHTPNKTVAFEEVRVNCDNY